MQSAPPDPRNAAVAPSTLRRACHWTLALLVACVAFGHASPALSHESEQYTLPTGRDFADLGPYFSKIAYGAVVAAVAETNAAIARAVEHTATDDGSPAQLAELQSADFVAGKVWQSLFMAIPTNELLDATLISEPVQSQYPGLVTMYRPPVSIYDDPLLVIDLTKAVRTFFRAGTVSADGQIFGTDKIIHFINVGRIYHVKYESRIRRGLPEEEAIKSAIASTSRNPLTSEAGVLGMLTTGIHSNGDLAADYAGLMFYRNLTEPVTIGPRVLPPMLVRDGPYWRVQAAADSDFFVAFITPHWNEVLNPSRYARYTSGRLRTLVSERCALALDWYRDARGQRRDRAQFEAIERELATYFGEPYGHESSPAHAVTIAELCFPDGTARGDGGGVAATDAAAATAVSAATGPDELGRTPLWWAAREGKADAVRAIASTGAPLDAADLDGETALHAATRAGSVATVRELVGRGADLDRASIYGVTPLMLATASGHNDVAVVLLQAGARPNARDIFGRTALHDAARRGNLAMARLLLEHGADPRIASNGGNTPLHFAARHGHDAVDALLVMRGADLMARNGSDATARDEASDHGHASTALQLTGTAMPPHHDPTATTTPMALQAPLPVQESAPQAGANAVSSTGKAD